MTPSVLQPFVTLLHHHWFWNGAVVARQHQSINQSSEFNPVGRGWGL